MKQLLLLIWFICAFQYSFAEVDDSNVVHDLTSIVIRQKFESTGHCMPEFDNSKVYINPESDAFELLISSANNENNKIDSVTYEYDFGKKEKTFKKGDRLIPPPPQLPPMPLQKLYKS
ncbi:MAG: hypothetical protein MJ069_09660 [Salinivirgaceae bacterium]|nr:hypothetical protein [Salinivirgaceae bacterium]